MNFGQFSSLLAVLSLMVVSTSPALGDDCSEMWSPPYVPYPYVPSVYADQDTRYWGFRVVTGHTGDEMVDLEFRATFPFTRYESYHVYAQSTENLVTYRLDNQFDPNPGNNNPFRPPGPGETYDRDTPERNYTFWVVSENSPRATDSSIPDSNRLVIPAEVAGIDIRRRIYTPDIGEWPLGGVDAAGVQAYEPGSFVSTSCPDSNLKTDKTDLRSPGQKLPSQDNFLSKIDEVDPQETIYFYLISGSGNHPNSGNRYYGAPVDQVAFGDLAVVRVKAPSVIQSSPIPGGGTFSGDEEVRYFSLCMYGVYSTAYSSCYGDYEMKEGEDDMVTVILADKNSSRYDYGELENLANTMGAKLMDWGMHYEHALVFRHLEPSEEFAAVLGDAQPYIDSDIPAEELSGIYAPKGIHCPGEEPLGDLAENFCGLGR